MNSAFFLDRMDYVFFVYGTSCVLLSLIAFCLAHREGEKVGWSNLAWFGLLHCFFDYGDMLVISIGDTWAFQAARLFVGATSFLFLLRFGLPAIPSRFSRGKRLLPLSLIIAAALFLSQGLTAFQVGMRYVLSLPASILSAFLLIKLGRHTPATPARSLAVSGFAFLGYAIAAGILVPQADFFPASHVNAEAFFRVFGIHVQLFRGGLLLLIGVALWKYLHASETNLQTPDDIHQQSLFGKMGLVTLLIILTLGAAATENAGISSARSAMDALLAQSRLAAGAINHRRLIHLTATPEDTRHPDYQRIREQLVFMCEKESWVRWIYLLKKRDGHIVFLADSIPLDDVNHTEPGVLYREPPVELHDVFRTGKAATVGPYTDEWGTFVSGFVPITAPETGAILAVIGLDVDASRWRQGIARDRLHAILITMLFLLLSLGSMTLRQVQRQSHLHILGWKNRYDLITRAADLIAYEYDFASGNVIWSGSMEQVLGYRVDEVAGSVEGWRKLIHPTDAGNAVARFEEAAQNGVRYESEYRCIRKDGSVRWILDVGCHFTDRTTGQKKLLGMMQDVTKRHEAELATRIEQDRAVRYFEFAGSLMLVLDPQGCVRKINRSGLTLLGYTEEELIGKNWFDTCIKADIRELQRQRFTDLYASPSSTTGRVTYNTIQTKSGEMRVVSWHRSVICTLADRSCQMLFSGQDMTELVLARANATKELVSASKFIRSLLPAPLTEGPIRCSWLFLPMLQIGGDIFGYQWLDDRYFTFYIIDVSGHGITAALLSTSVLDALRRKTLSAVDYRSPEAVLRALSQAFPMEEYNNYYFTIWYGVYDAAERRLRASAAGHPPALLREPGGHLTRLQVKAPFIGGFSSESYEVIERDIRPGTSLYLLTDGVYELPRANGVGTFDEFERLLETMDESNPDLLRTVFRNSSDKTGGRALQDDFTLVRIVFESPNPSEPTSGQRQGDREPIPVG
ncbi:MAG TPA: SpoIIE family protein phosphatase [Candidatus Ozemobacteraceae bacterium]